jgi:hypothetical protein
VDEVRALFFGALPDRCACDSNAMAIKRSKAVIVGVFIR